MIWRNIRFFVSSTFKDMDVERDALHSIVEPKLNEYLSKYCCSIEFVDLRHSVKTDAEKDQVEQPEHHIKAKRVYIDGFQQIYDENHHIHQKRSNHRQFRIDTHLTAQNRNDREYDDGKIQKLICRSRQFHKFISPFLSCQSKQ